MNRGDCGAFLNDANVSRSVVYSTGPLRKRHELHEAREVQDTGLEFVEGKRWNEFIARYHYLGYRTLVGAQMRYAVHDRDGWPVAMLGFSTAARKLARLLLRQPPSLPSALGLLEPHLSDLL